ncbi:hypothetical protein NDU88_006042 [Pleurodeles waltl]|uniref:Uncharacterized protein n=1 Tax=Pleurodeles waltl TaxID=8319 RepID=A0AAV7VNH7_PLEWA|nr:hypothetical protein NDU88_006042 [Pleurodeles waltl]
MIRFAHNSALLVRDSCPKKGKIQSYVDPQTGSSTIHASTTLYRHQLQLNNPAAHKVTARSPPRPALRQGGRLPTPGPPESPRANRQLQHQFAATESPAAVSSIQLRVAKYH